MPTLPARELYERQPGESSGAFHCFAIYRDLGPKRSLSEVSRILEYEQQQQEKTQTRIFFPHLAAPEDPDAPVVPVRTAKRKVAGGHIGLYSRKHNWIDRAQAWDDYLDQQRRLRYQNEVEKMAAKHARNIEASLAAVMVPIAEFLTSLRDEERNADFKKATSMKLLDAALECITVLPKLHEAERQARGVRIRKPGKDESVQGGGFDWEINEYQPPRETPIDLSEWEQRSAPTEWEGDKPCREEVDDAEGKPWA